MSCVTRMMFKVVNVQYKESTFFFLVVAGRGVG